MECYFLAWAWSWMISIQISQLLKVFRICPAVGFNCIYKTNRIFCRGFFQIFFFSFPSLAAMLVSLWLLVLVPPTDQLLPLLCGLWDNKGQAVILPSEWEAPAVLHRPLFFWMMFTWFSYRKVFPPPTFLVPLQQLFCLWSILPWYS